MQLIAGRTAQEYNQRKGRQGAFWEDRYHATAIQVDEHLHRCLVYIDLNMVRATGLQHPAEWKWSGHHELVGRRRRYRLVDRKKLLKKLCCDSEEQFRGWYETSLDEKLRQDKMQRESFWSDSRVVGDYEFVFKQTKRKERKNIVENESGTCYL